MARHDQPVHCLEAPVTCRERGCQPVEQLGVGRLPPETAEVVRRRRQTAPEVVLPQAVRHHPGGAQVAVVSDPAGQGTTAAGGGGVGGSLHKPRVGVAEDEREPGLHPFRRRVRVAADQHLGRRRLWADLLHPQDLDQIRWRTLDDRAAVVRRPQVGRNPVRVVLGRRLIAAADLVGRDAAEERQHPVVVGLRNRVAAVVVAAGTADRHAEHHPGGRIEDRVEIVVLGERGVRRFVVPDPQSQIAGGDDRGGRRVVDLVAGELVRQELVVRHVRVERVDHPVAVAPGGGLLAVPLVAVRLRVADKVEPVPAPALAVVRRREQAVDEALPGVGALILLEGLDLLQGRRQPGQVVGCAPDQCPAVGGGRRFEAGRLDSGEQEVVDRVERPVRVRHRGNVGAHERSHGPPCTVGVGDLERVLGRRDLRELVLGAAEGRAEQHPLPDRFDLRVGQPT